MSKKKPTKLTDLDKRFYFNSGFNNSRVDVRLGILNKWINEPHFQPEYKLGYLIGCDFYSNNDTTVFSTEAWNKSVKNGTVVLCNDGTLDALQGK